MVSFAELFNLASASASAEEPKRNTREALADNPRDFNNTAMETFSLNSTVLTEKEIMGIPAVSAGIKTITNSIAQLPIELHRKSDDKNGKVIVEDDYRLDLINSKPNESMTGYDFKSKIVRDVILYGASKSYIEFADETSLNVKAIYPLDMEKMTITVKTNDGYSFRGIDYLDSIAGRRTFYDEMLLSVLKDTNNGITGKGLINEHYEILQLAIAQSSYETNLIGNGATPTSVLETDQKMTSDVIQTVRNSWASLYSGVKNAGKTVILEQGLHYKPISYGPDDLQLTEGKKSVISDIARILNMPESMINAAANKYDSNEQNNIWFMQTTLSPLMAAMENAINNALLTEVERLNGYRFSFNTENMTKITTEAKTDIAIKKFNAGIIDNVAAAKITGDYVENDQVPYFKVTTGAGMYTPSNGNIANPNTGVVMNFQTGEVISNGIQVQAPSLGKPTTQTISDTATADKNTTDKETPNGN